MLTKDELERYDRQIMIRGFGREGQERLKNTKAVVAGVGGLGSPIAIYLAAAGIGTIRLIDHGALELSNLNRQVLHFTDDVNRKKVVSASEKLRKLNPDINIETVDETITESNVASLANDFDLIVDAMDNLPARYLLNKVAIEANIPFFHGAVWGLEGRAMTILPGKSACLQCIYHGAVTSEGKFPIIGTAPAIIGAIQVTEVVKYVVGLGDLLLNRLLVYDGLSQKFTEFKVNKDPDCEHCGHLKKEE